MTWAQRSVIYESINRVRSAVGFDTFAGFANIRDKDRDDGETLAIMETVSLRNLRIRRFPFASAVSFAVLE